MDYTEHLQTRAVEEAGEVADATLELQQRLAQQLESHRAWQHYLRPLIDTDKTTTKDAS